MMKNSSGFLRVVVLVVLTVVCFALTIGLAFYAGSCEVKLLDFENLNFYNMIPVLLIGGFITCVMIGITVLYVSRTLFIKVKNKLFSKNGGDKK